MPTLEHFGRLREGLLLDADYVTLDGAATIRLWVRSQGEALALLDPAFEPYFYAVLQDGAEPAAAAERVRGLRVGDVRPRRVEVARRKEGLHQVDVLRIVAWHPAEVPRLREAVPRVEGLREAREADIPFAFRYLIDRNLRPMGGLAFEARPSERLPGALEAQHVEARDLPELEREAKVLAFDLEVYNPRLVPRPREDPVLLVSVATSGGLLDVLANDGATPAECARRDKDLIARFVDLVKREDPDVLVTYNGDEFDWPYLAERARLHKLRLDLGRDGSEPSAKQAGLHRHVSVAGRENVDLLRVAERDLGEVKVKTLKNVADFLGVVELEERVLVRKDRIHALWDDPSQRPTLVAYARDDARSTMELAAKLLPLQAELARLTRIPLDEESKMGRGRQVDFFLLAEAFRRGMLAPAKGFVQEEMYEGGLVLEPPKGLHEHVVALDFSSMYPSIMLSYNVSPETYVGPEAAAAFKPGELWQAPEVGHQFLREPRGFFPSILEELVQKRRGWKKVMAQHAPGSPEHTLADVKQKTLKILTNAFYGYTGWSGARWYQRACAEATAAWGRHIVTGVVEEARREGLEVLYGDSVTEERFVTVRSPTGTIQVRNIAQLFDEAAAVNCAARGGKEYAPGLGYEALTMDPAGQPCWSPIVRVMRHRADKRIVRVSQKFGETRVTEDHALMVADHGRLEAARPSEVRLRPLAHVRSVPPGKAVEMVDLLAYLGPYEASWVARGRRRVARVREVDGRLSFSWSNRTEPITVPRFIAVDSPEFESLCRLLGAYVAEGSSSTPETTASRTGASIANSDVAWLRRLQADYHRLFAGAKSCVVRSTRGQRVLQEKGKTFRYHDRTSKLQMMNKLAAVFFRQLCGQRSSGKRLPDFAFNIPARFQRIILETMVEGDGSHAADARYTDAYRAANFAYTTTSLELACDVSLLLAQLGIHATLNYRPSKRAYTFKTSSTPNARIETRVTREAYRGAVYDLEVQGTHTFVDSCGHILLHNTDSIFVKDNSRIPAFVERINASQPLELDLQERFAVVFFTGAKKRYAGLTEGGKIVARGLEVRRGDWCELAKELQEGVLDLVLRRRDPQAALKLAQDAARRVREGQASLEELTIHKTLTMEPGDYKAKQAHVHALEAAQRRQPDLRVAPGSKIGYVVLKAKGPLRDALPSERAVLAEFAQGVEELDLQYYVDKQLAPAALRVLGHFGYTEDDVRGAPRQQSLKDWFGA